MEVGQGLTEAEERTRAMSIPHDVPIRSAPPQQSTRPFDDHPSSNVITAATADPVRSRPSEVWAGAISRVQTQVSLNTGLLDSERQKVHHIERTLERLERNVNEAMTMVQHLCDEVRSRPSHETRRHDPADLQVISEQVGVLSTRVNEVDALRMRVTLLENRLRRQEEHGSPAVTDTRPATGATHRDMPYRDASMSSQPIAAPPAPNMPPTHQPFPPMRTSANMSPAENHPMQHTPVDLRQQPAEPFAPTHASSAGSFRLGEPLPPPSTLAGWRTGGEPLGSVSGLPPPLSAGPGRPHVLPTDVHSTGWAAVNAAPTGKRPYEEPRQSPYESSLPGSPKRPRLAPIMPRSSYSDDSSFVPSGVPKSGTADSYVTHSRAPSDGSQSQSLPTPASANMPGRRFIISTQAADSQESWRPEHERTPHMGPHGRGHGHAHGHAPHGHGHGRRGGRGGRTRGRGHGHGPRGGRGGVLLTEGYELGTPDWERADWSGSQIPPNGSFHPLNHSPHSPEDSSRGGFARRGRGAAGVVAERETETPATPLAMQSAYDPFAAGNADSAAAQQTSGGKKSRTKPFRNSEGILIRKDGRPDMRSVSSANNLRKVHAKKEAERAEMEARTPTSARSLAPAGSMSDDEPESQSGSPEAQTSGGEDRAKQNDTRKRHRELMSRIFPSDVEEESRSVGERSVPSPDHHRNASESVVKSEMGSNEGVQPLDSTKDAADHSPDVVMEETSEVDGEDGKGNARGAEAEDRMSTVVEVSEEQEPVRENTT